MSITYVALIHKANKKNADYGIIFPDFPGCIFGGKTVDAALENARDGIIFHIGGLLELGELLPEPTPLQVIDIHNDYKNATPALIRVIIPTGNLKRLNITMDAGLIAEIDHAIKLSGKNRSQFLSEAARHMLA